MDSRQRMSKLMSFHKVLHVVEGKKTFKTFSAACEKRVV